MRQARSDLKAKASNMIDRTFVDLVTMWIRVRSVSLDQRSSGWQKAAVTKDALSIQGISNRQGSTLGSKQDPLKTALDVSTQGNSRFLGIHHRLKPRIVKEDPFSLAPFHNEECGPFMIEASPRRSTKPVTGCTFAPAVGTSPGSGSASTKPDAVTSVTNATLKVTRRT
jgi:hypothetical protein